MLSYVCFKEEVSSHLSKLWQKVKK